MLLAFALISLFCVAALGVLGVLCDTFARGLRAYPQLKLAARTGEQPKARIRLIETINIGELPAVRPAKAVRFHSPTHIGRAFTGREVSVAA